MNDKTAELLQKLAEKFGTTTEYLWGVLLKQARVDATVQLIQTVVIIALGFILWRVHKKLIKKQGNDKYSDCLYEKWDGAPVLMTIAAIVYVLLALTAFFTFDNIINGYFNPEYWALKQVLNKI